MVATLGRVKTFVEHVQEWVEWAIGREEHAKVGHYHVIHTSIELPDWPERDALPYTDPETLE